MDEEKILEITGTIEEKLGKENYAIISDNIGEILTGVSDNVQQLKERDEKIKSLKDRNEKLVTANGALLQKIPAIKQDEVDETPKQQKAKPISFKEAFDPHGNFIH